jgi:hypothetical protein
MADKKDKVTKRTDLDKTVFDYSVPKWNFDKDDQINPACTAEENEAWAKNMAALFGTRDKDNMSASLQQLLKIVGAGRRPEDLNGVMATMHAINPQDELEAMLAIQMIGTHHLTTLFMSRAASSENPDLVTLQTNRATKLSRTFLAQLEALNKHRGKGQQKMTIEHVNVESGGQAIVGNIRGGQK